MCVSEMWNHKENEVGMGARASVVVEALSYKLEGRAFETQLSQCISSIYLINPVALGLVVHSASKRNEYQKQKNNVSWK
jgi:hypothetical protein